MTKKYFQNFQKMKIFEIFFIIHFEIFSLQKSKFQKKSQKHFDDFFSSKKNFFLELKKKSDHSFDAEKAYLSIGGIFRAIRVV